MNLDSLILPISPSRRNPSGGVDEGVASGILKPYFWLACSELVETCEGVERSVGELVVEGTAGIMCLLSSM